MMFEIKNLTNQHGRKNDDGDVYKIDGDKQRGKQPLRSAQELVYEFSSNIFRSSEYHQLCRGDGEERRFCAGHKAGSEQEKTQHDAAGDKRNAYSKIRIDDPGWDRERVE